MDEWNEEIEGRKERKKERKKKENIKNFLLRRQNGGQIRETKNSLTCLQICFSSDEASTNTTPRPKLPAKLILIMIGSLVIIIIALSIVLLLYIKCYKNKKLYKFEEELEGKAFPI
jgi:hypothetical protein